MEERGKLEEAVCVCEDRSTLVPPKTTTVLFRFSKYGAQRGGRPWKAPSVVIATLFYALKDR